MTIRLIGPLLCGGLLAFAVTTGAIAQTTSGGQIVLNHDYGYDGALSKKKPGSAKKGSAQGTHGRRDIGAAENRNTSDRMGGGGGRGSAGKRDGSVWGTHQNKK